MKSTKKETWKMVILFPVISGQSHFGSFSFSVIFIVYYFFFRIFATNYVKMSYYIINRLSNKVINEKENYEYR